MTDHSISEIFASIQNAISEIANVEPDEIAITDHLETDLMLDPATDLPKIMKLVSQELELEEEIRPETTQHLIDECLADPDKAHITEVIDTIQEEIEFN